jgi:hypothetical protein
MLFDEVGFNVAFRPSPKTANNRSLQLPQSHPKQIVWDVAFPRLMESGVALASRAGISVGDGRASRPRGRTRFLLRLPLGLLFLLD